jgi:hypothetical protein
MFSVIACHRWSEYLVNIDMLSDGACHCCWSGYLGSQGYICSAEMQVLNRTVAKVTLC